MRVVIAIALGLAALVVAYFGEKRANSNRR